MNALIAIFYFALALLGSDAGSRTLVERVRVDGADILYSRVVTQPAITRFECLRSASGRCYYTLFPRRCAQAAAASGGHAAGCLSRPVERFALARGQRRQIVALPEFTLCVGIDASSTVPDCTHADRIATR